MSNSNQSGTIAKTNVSARTQIFAAAAFAVFAVALPQIFHAIGSIAGLGSVPGEIFLPMHLPVILGGLLFGPCAGFISGFLAPICSFALSGMPKLTMLPFMVVELAAYGLCAGLLKNVKIATIAKVAITQIAGRAVRAIAIVFAVRALKVETVGLPVIWMSVLAGLPGLILQWTFLPLIVFRAVNGKWNERSGA